MIHKTGKNKDGKKSLHVPNVKLFSKIIFNIFGLFAAFWLRKTAFLITPTLCFVFSTLVTIIVTNSIFHLVVSKTCKLAAKPNKKLVP